MGDISGETVRRISKAALGGVVGCALILGGTQAADASMTYKYSGELTDLQTGTVDVGVFDSTHAKVTIVQDDDSTTFSIKVTGIDVSAAGTEFGAHLHVGPCMEGVGLAAGPHYNSQMWPAGTLTDYALAVKNPETEVPSAEDGAARHEVMVPFVPVDLDGVMSIVIHVESTNHDTGGAGARQACFPLSVPEDWIYKPLPLHNAAP
jgi:Cu/Zn superoxide dismutase